MAFYGPLFDATRDFQRVVIRCYVLPEYASSALMQMIVGVRPDSGCSNAAFGVVLVSAAMLLYLVKYRPYRTKLDTAFSLAINFMQVALSIFTIIAVRSNADEDHFSVKGIQVLLHALLVSYFAQVAAQGYWAYHCQARRKQQQVDNHDDDESRDQETEMAEKSAHRTRSTKRINPPRVPAKKRSTTTRVHDDGSRLRVPLLNPLEGDGYVSVDVKEADDD